MKTHTKIVSDSGAIRLFLSWNPSRTKPSTSSTTLSTPACSLPGRPVEMFFATLRNRQQNTRPRMTRKGHRVDVDRPEIAGAVVPDPLAVAAAHLQIGEVVLDVFAGGFAVTARMFFFHSSALRHRFCAPAPLPTSRAPNTTSCAAMKPANTASG